MSPLQEAYRIVRKKAFGHYENFPVASWLLPQPQRDAVAAVYAFARQADDYADEPEFEGRRLACLRAWRAQLQARPTTPEFLALNDARRRFDIPLHLLKDLVSAFESDCRLRRHPHFRSLLDYCRHSANPVGRIMLRIFGLDSPEALAASDSICTALQLTNFWQDLRSDVVLRDRVYLPADEMRRFGVRLEDLKRPQAGAALKALMRFQVERSEHYFAEGEALCREWRGPLGRQVRLTVLGGRRILEQIRAGGYDTLAKRPALGAADLPWILSRFLTGRTA